MGHRANYILVDNDKEYVFYHHWGALSLPADFFWGYEESLHYLSTLEPSDHLLDDIWCEGAISIKPETKELILFGGEDICYNRSLRNVFLSLLSISWSGWRVKWAEEGIVDVVKLSSISPEKVQLNYEDDEPNSLSKPFDDTFEYDKWPQTLILVRADKDIITSSKDYAQTLLGCGPELLNMLSKAPRRDIIPEGNDEFLESQLFIDINNKAIHFWDAGEIEDMSNQFKPLWDGWKITAHTDGFYGFCQISNIPYFKYSRSRDEYIRQLSKMLLHESDFDPEEVLARIVRHLDDNTSFLEKIKSKVVNIFTKKKSKVTVSHHFFQKDKPGLNRQDKIRYLSSVIDAFISRMPNLESIVKASNEWFVDGAPASEQKNNE